MEFREKEKMMRSKLQLLLIFSIIGLLVSLYLVFDHFFPESRRICDLSSTVSCTVLNKSPFSKLFGVPVAVHGVLWFAVLISLIINTFWYLEEEVKEDSTLSTPATASTSSSIQPPQNFNTYKLQYSQATLITSIFYWAAIGIFFVFYLIMAEIIVGAMCPFCTIIHILNAIILILSYQMYKRQKGYPSTIALISNMKIWVGVIGFIGLTIIIIWNVSVLTTTDPVVLEAQKQMKLNLARCIGSKDIKMYGSSTCGHCIYQKELFGAEIFSSEIKFIDCLKDDKASCNEKKYRRVSNLDKSRRWKRSEINWSSQSIGISFVFRLSIWIIQCIIISLLYHLEVNLISKYNKHINM